MSSILDQVGADETQFRPRSISEFFGLQLARKLESLDRLRLYLTLVERHGRAEILLALTRARKRSNGVHMADRFKQELNKIVSRHE